MTALRNVGETLFKRKLVKAHANLEAQLESIVMDAATKGAHFVQVSGTYAGILPGFCKKHNLQYDCLQHPALAEVHQVSGWAK